MSNYPCDRIEAVLRARRALTMGGQYQLGTGDFHPATPDTPFTGPQASDCAGFAICWAWKIVRHRPGFNNGPWASVSDDVNVNSAVEDARHHQELFHEMPMGGIPQWGDLICYPTIRIPGADGATHTFIGHVAFIESVPGDFQPHERWSRLRLLQCHGPNGQRPAVVRTDGSMFDHHDGNWPKAEHRTTIIRPRTRVVDPAGAVAVQ